MEITQKIKKKNYCPKFKAVARDFKIYPYSPSLRNTVAILTIKNAVQIQITPAITSAPFSSELVMSSPSPTRKRAKNNTAITVPFFIKQTSLSK